MNVIDRNIQEHVRGFQCRFGLMVDGIVGIQTAKAMCNAKPIIRAKWTKVTDRGVYFWACSNCHNKALKNEYGFDFFSPFCPFCSAEMEFEEEYCYEKCTDVGDE